MKWGWIFMLVLLVPSGVQGSSSPVGVHAAGVWDPAVLKKKEKNLHFSNFMVSTLSDIDNVRMKIRLFVDPTIQPPFSNSSFCALTARKDALHTSEAMTIVGDHGLELFVPQMKAGGSVFFMMKWAHAFPRLAFASIEVYSDQGGNFDLWKNDDISAGKDQNEYQEIRLEDVCGTLILGPQT